jgi:hypothetical protein
VSGKTPCVARPSYPLRCDDTLLLVSRFGGGAGLHSTLQANPVEIAYDTSGPVRSDQEIWNVHWEYGDVLLDTLPSSSGKGDDDTEVDSFDLENHNRPSSFVAKEYCYVEDRETV